MEVLVGEAGGELELGLMEVSLPSRLLWVGAGKVALEAAPLGAATMR